MSNLFTKEQLESALEQSGGNRDGAARILFVSPASITRYRKIYGIPRDKTTRRFPFTKEELPGAFTKVGNSNKEAARFLQASPLEVCHARKVFGTGPALSRWEQVKQKCQP